MYAFFVKFKICMYVRLYRGNGIHDNKKPSNLHKNSLFSSYVISNVIVMENYKRCFENSLPFQSSINTSHMSFVIWGFILALLASHFLFLELGHVGWNCSGYGCFMSFLLAQSTCGQQSLTITVSTNQSFCLNNFEIQ